MSVSLPPSLPRPPSLALSVTFTHANMDARTHARNHAHRGVRAREPACTYLARVAPAREGEEVLAEVAAARGMLCVAATCVATPSRLQRCATSRLLANSSLRPIGRPRATVGSTVVRWVLTLGTH